MRKPTRYAWKRKCLPFLGMLLLVAAAGHNADAQSLVDFGTVALGATSSVQTLTFTIVSGGELRAPLVVTQGITGLDFADAGTGSCTTNGTAYIYAAGATCTVDLLFQPKAAGGQKGAVQILRSGGAVVATVRLSGTGLGPQLAFSSVALVAHLSGTSFGGVATDAANNLFFTQSPNGTLLKATKPAAAGSGWPSPVDIGSGYSNPEGVAVDGLGDVFVADEGDNRVMEVPHVGATYGAQTEVSATGLSGPSGVAVDAAGDLFVSDSLNDRVLELPWSGSKFEAQITLPITGLSNPQGIAVDGQNDLFVCDTGNHRVVELPWSGSGYGDQQTVGSGFSSPTALTTNSSGGLYVADAGAGDIVSVPWTGEAFGEPVVLFNKLTNPSSVAVDPEGDVFLVDQAQSGRLSIAQWSLAPTLQFFGAAAGAVSKPLNVTLQNIGNAPLVFPVPASGSNPSFSFPYFGWDPSSTCPQLQAGDATPFTLVAGAGCTLAIDAVPEGSGGQEFEGSALLTDNALGEASLQKIPLAGSVKDIVSKLVLTAPASAVAGTALTVSATAVNGSGATVTAFNGTVPVSSSDKAALLPTTVTFNEGLASFSATLVTAGEQAIELDNAASPGLKGISPDIDVNPNTPGVVAVSGTPQSHYVQSHFTNPLTAAVRDAYGNGFPGMTVTFADPATGASAVLSAASCTTATDGSCDVTATANQTAGSYQVTATSSGITGNAVFSLTNEAPPDLVVTSARDDAGKAANCTVQTSPTAGTDTACSLRDALLEAATLGSAHVGFDASRFTSATTITLSGTTIAIPTLTSVTGLTSGSGSKMRNLVTINANGLSSAFSIAAAAKAVSVENLTITGATGGAINNAGSLTVNSCTLMGNTINSGAEGAGIFNSGTLAVTDSTMANNGLISGGQGGFGGAIYNTSTGNLTIASSTIANNQTGSEGGAIYNLGTMTIADSTFANNVTAYAGGAILNGGKASVTNSILAGDTPDECGGIGCATGPAYLQISGSETGTQSGNITVAFTDSKANQYSVTVTYGAFSTPASIASAIGSYFTENAVGVAAQAFGAVVELQLTNGASFGTFTITNPSTFKIARVTEKQILNGGGNFVDGAGTLTPLDYYGGPTQTMIPLPENAAICGGDASLIPTGVTTDQRGGPDTNTNYPGYSAGAPCVDAGAVQTQYAMSFTSQPPALVSQNQVMAPAPVVTLTESGIAATAVGDGKNGATILLTDSAHVLGGTTTETLNAGVATFSDLLLSSAATGDMLSATLALSPDASLTAQASTPVTTRAVPAITWATPAPITYGTALSAGQLDATASVAGTFKYTPAAGTVLTAGLQTLSVTFTPTDKTNFSTATASVTLTVNRKTPVITWPVPAAITYGTALSATQLDARTGGAAGTFTYSPSSGSVLPAGTQTLLTTFTPADTQDLNTATASVSLTVNPVRAPAPAFTPAAATYASPVQVTISDATSSTIYYTTNGTTPNPATSLIFTQPIPVSSTTTIKAIAVPASPDYSQSVVSTGIYTFPAATAKPAFSPLAGTYTKPQSVNISDGTSSASIFYTTDGSTPTSSSTLYTGAIAVNEGETIKAVAIASGYAQSAYGVAAYTLDLPPAAMPEIAPSTGTYSGTQTVTITDTIPGATIYYTLDGTYPSTSSPVYSNPFTVSSATTVTAAAIASGYGLSPDATSAILLSGNPSPLIYTVAGNETQGYSGDGVEATLSAFDDIENVARDAAGNLYIADAGNNRIRKVAAGTGIVTTIAGTGIAGYSGDNGPATAAQIDQPMGIVVGSSGNVYFTDSVNECIRKINASTGIITTAYTVPLNGFPTGLAIDKDNNLYVVSFLKVLKISQTGLAMTIAGNGGWGYTGDGGPAVNAELGNPQGVAVDVSGNVYIADSYNHVIRKVAVDTGIITTVAGNGRGSGLFDGGGFAGDGGPATSAELNQPEGIAVDKSANLYIADTWNHRIRMVNAGTGIITTLAGDGDACYAALWDGNPADEAGLCYPAGVMTDSVGDVYIANTWGSTAREIPANAAPPTAVTATPVASLAAGPYSGPQTATLSDSTPGAAIYVTLDGSRPTTISQQYFGPIQLTGSVTLRAVAIAPRYLPSQTSSEVYTITSPPASVISTYAGNGFYGFSGLGGLATKAAFGYIYGLAFDSSGDLFIADEGNSVVWKITAASGKINVVAGIGISGYSGDGGLATRAELDHPQSVAVDAQGNLYIADLGNQRVRMVSAATGVISTVAGNGTYNYNGDGGQATRAGVVSPQAIAIDSRGNLYIAEENPAAVREVSADTGIITTVVGNGVDVFGGDGGLAANATLQNPVAIAIDKADNLYIGDSGRIRRVTASTGIITTIAGNGDFGCNGDGGPATQALLYVDPSSLATDAGGDIYFSNEGEVREIVPSTGVITAVAGDGYQGFRGDGGSATMAGLTSPYGVALDNSGNLYIADQLSYRVRKVTFAPTAVPSQ